ncbi:MAG: hypothetical protein KJ995_04715 [Candidatus Omnitrophica bacterium]|nr:hypothetical protein [Candidatus Omnitrophota bacterium]MBU1127464.1 hypothetical protein [Candidatus Omnitrophota bacterium]MBU1785062.1 hypothetical protein [Candidatus Omnitrophota bacterium]MBU1851688.1 hypothetical protein [Candidatus Omnitrophota bacterium]
MRKTKFIFTIIVIILTSIAFYKYFLTQLHENRILKQVVQRLEAESRIAEVLVTNVQYDEGEKKLKTTIKFLEYNTGGRPLDPKYFTFSGNIIQFQSLVIRFDDIHIKSADKLRGKSAYLFWKVFLLDGKNAQEYDITNSSQVPKGYKVEGDRSEFEKKIWEQFWSYALNNQETKKAGVTNAQIEAPGTMFIPGMLYTIKMEHDGGMRIDSSPLPSILKGEKIPE